MTETHVQELEGERVRYNGDAWEFTGTIDVKRNGEVIHVEARKAERVRGDKATLRFTLQNPPASINPGNLGDFGVELQRREDGQYLVVSRTHATNRYRLDNMNYT
ncbi:hypothetical protein [Halegenticoccus soli]|uniref:hypothetical protein n=1 Tax=Halegenticoccus soli TaxID=1985678 RepID=UPI000C6D3521|nr:hypothetical protein [Halegenticoccus soli]